MWAALASMIMSLSSLPPFQIITIVYFIGTIFSLSVNKVRTGKSLGWGKYPPYIWLCGILGIFGNGVAFIMALQNAPAAHADLINYLWPLFLILLTPTLSSEKFSSKRLCAGIVAFLGIALLVTNGNLFTGVNSKYMYGYMWALMSALSWTAYTFSCKIYGKPSPNIIYIFCGTSFLLSLSLHLSLETFVMPSVFEMLILCLMGLTSHSSAFYLWDYGIKKGNFKLLCILSYCNPITSVMFLILFGFAKLTPLLGLATAMVSGASFIYMMKWGGIFRKIRKLFSEEAFQSS